MPARARLGASWGGGGFWRLSSRAVGRSWLDRATRQATAVSTVSAGRQTSRWGIRRRLGACSIACGGIGLDIALRVKAQRGRARGVGEVGTGQVGAAAEQFRQFGGEGLQRQL